MKVVYGLIGILAIVAQTTGAAQELRRDTLCASVWFTAGSSAVDPAHEQNGEALDRLVDRLRRLQADPATRIDAVTIRGWASPDGSSRFNRQLAETRARRTADTLARRTALPEALFAFEGGGIDWQRLEEAVERSAELPDRDEVLHILRHTPVWVIRDGKVVDSRKRRLGMLRGGNPYHTLCERHFPSLRRADICAAFTTDLKSPPLEISENRPVKNGRGIPDAVQEETSAQGTASLPAGHREEAVLQEASRVLETATAEQEAPRQVADDERTAPQEHATVQEHATIQEHAAAQARTNPQAAADPSGRKGLLRAMRCPAPRIALRTNLLYDALLVPNIGLEYRFAKRWSVTVDYRHAWWSRNSRHRYWRCYGGDLLLRRYFGNRPFTGHHIGLFGTMLSYDFEFSGKGRQSDGFNLGGGFEYGYAFPVARRLRLDCSLGLGYVGGRYKEYEPMDDCYVHERTRRLRWFGPARAEIALVWLLGRNTKGGAR